MIPFGDGGQLNGRVTKDKVCLVESDNRLTCVDNGFNFFEITGMTNIKLANAYSGILGIAPDDPTNGPSFVASLKNGNYIKYKMLGINLQKSPMTSYVTFGGMSEFMMY